MAIKIAEADLAAHRAILIETLYRLLTGQSDARRFDWLYRNGFHGEARAWLAIDGHEEAVIGAAAAFPRLFYAGDGEISGWVLGDFCLDAAYRSLGPALHLQRACLGVTESNGGVFCYDFPSANMVAVYKRLGIEPTGRMLRLAKLLRVNRKVRERFTSRVAHHAISAVGNTFLNLATTNLILDPSLKLSIHEGQCGEEFSILAEEQRGRLGLCIQRSAEYLNWRYVNNPLATYKFITARRRGKLKGYAVWTRAGEDASVVDVFGENDPAMVKGLLSEVIGRLTKSGVMTLSVWLNESHPWLSWCSEMGFRVRDSAPMVCIPARSLTKTVELPSNRWFLMQGDRDS
jgi:hypothetical protein